MSASALSTISDIPLRARRDPCDYEDLALSRSPGGFGFGIVCLPKLTALSRAKPPGGSTQAHDNEFVHWAEAARSRPKPPATGTIVQALSSAQGGLGEA